MSYSHRQPSVEPHLARTGEWDSPRDQHRTRPVSATPSTSRGSPRTREGQLIKAEKPVYSALKQQVLSEDDYLHHLSQIIQRDFFPHLKTLDAQHDLLAAFEAKDNDRIESGIRRMRELDDRTPRVVSSRGRSMHDATPGRTPYSDSLAGDQTPLYLSATPTPHSTSSSSRRPLPSTSTSDPTAHLTLDQFQARYTSVDNSSFASLLSRDNEQRKVDHHWAFAAEGKANRKAIRGREARERLVEVTRGMVEEGGGTVRMLDGVAGRPGERRLLVNEGVDMGGGGGRLMIKGRDAKERLLLTAGGEDAKEDTMGKGKEVQGARVDEKAKQFVDWDRPTVEEEEDRREEREVETQVLTDAWPFKTRNSLMFPPDADRSNPSSLMPPPSLPTRAQPLLPLGDPKGIRYGATRMMELERPTRSGSGASEAGSDWTETTGGGRGVTASRIGAAVAGTPYPAPHSNTPRVSGFSFVDALPSPSSSSLPPSALQELMTWGTIEATPVALRSSGGSGGGGGADDYSAAVGPFRVRENDRREELALRMAKKAKRSLAEAALTSGRESRGSGLALDARPTPSSLHRNLLSASVRGTPSGFSPRAGGSSSATTPRADDLSPAARTLLGRTKPGRALDGGLGRSRQWGVDEGERERERKRRRAEERAREVEGRERLRRERWTPSPAVSMGFDPDLDVDSPGRTPKRRTLK